MIERLANIWASTLAYMFIHQTIPFSLDLIGFWASDGHAVYAELDRYMLIHPGELGEGMVSLTGQVLLVSRRDLASLRAWLLRGD